MGCTLLKGFLLNIFFPFNVPFPDWNPTDGQAEEVASKDLLPRGLWRGAEPG